MHSEHIVTYSPSRPRACGWLLRRLAFTQPHLLHPLTRPHQLPPPPSPPLTPPLPLPGRYLQIPRCRLGPGAGHVRPLHSPTTPLQPMCTPAPHKHAAHISKSTSLQPRVINQDLPARSPMPPSLPPLRLAGGSTNPNPNPDPNPNPNQVGLPHPRLRHLGRQVGHVPEARRDRIWRRAEADPPYRRDPM